MEDTPLMQATKTDKDPIAGRASEMVSPSSQAAVREEELWLNSGACGTWPFGTQHNQEAWAVIVALRADKYENMRYWAQSMVLGPSVRRAFICTMLMWGTFFFLPAFAIPFLQCDAEGLARYPKWLLSLMALPLLLPMAIEVQCLRDLLPAQMFIIAENKEKRGGTIAPKMLSCKLSLNLFACITLALSLLAHLDFVTNSLFVARAWKTHNDECSPDTVTQVFNTIMHKAHWPFNYLDQVPVSRVVLYAWLAMFPQLVFALSKGVPRDSMRQFFSGILHGMPKGFSEEELQKYNFAMNDRSKKDQFSRFLTYSTWAVDRTHHQESFFALADASRMKSVRFLAWTCMELSIQTEGARYGKKAGHIFNELKLAVRRFILYVILESVVFMQIQATSLGLARCHEEDHHVDAHLLFSVTISVLSTGVSFIQSVLDFRRIFIAVGQAEPEDPKADKYWEEERGAGKKSSTHYNEWTQKKGRYHEAALFALVSLVFAASWLLAAAKLVMNSTDCTCGWNLSWPPQHGCINDVQF